MREVEHQEAEVRVADVGKAARHGYPRGMARRVHARDDPRGSGIGDVDHLQACELVRDVCVAAGDGDPQGEGWKCDAAQECGRGRVRDVDDRESAGSRAEVQGGHVGAGAPYRDAVRALREENAAQECG